MEGASAFDCAGRGPPLFSTCGGFPACHVIRPQRTGLLTLSSETAPDAILLYAPLSCPLVEVTEPVRFCRGSRIAAAYGRGEAVEGYRCSYGLNARFRAMLFSGPLRVAAQDSNGDVRAVELDRHPFFVATLFQPERAALKQLFRLFLVCSCLRGVCRSTFGCSGAVSGAASRTLDITFGCARAAQQCVLPLAQTHDDDRMTTRGGADPRGFCVE